MKRCLALFILSVQFFFSHSLFAEEPLKAVATIKPIHSLVNMVTDALELPAPQLLLEGHADPHHFSLKPSQAKMLEEADIVFYANEQIETFLQKRIKENPVKYFPPIAFKEADAKKYSHAWLDMKLSLTMLKSILVAYRSSKTLGENYVEDVSSKKIFEIPQTIMDKFIERSNAYLAEFASHKGRTVWFDSLVGVPFVEQFGLKGDIFANRSADSTGKECFVITHGRNAKMERIGKAQGHKVIRLDLVGSAIPAGPMQYFHLMDELVQDISECLT